MNSAINHAAASANDQVLVTGIKTRLRWSLIGAAACLLVGVYYYSAGERLLALCFIGAGLFFPLFESFESFYPFLNGKQQFGRSARYRSLYWVLLTLAIIVAVYLTRNLLWTVMVYMVTASGLLSVFLFTTIRKANLSSNDDRTALGYGKQLTGIQAIGIVALQFDKLVIGLALGFSQLAVYSIAAMIANLPSVLATSVISTIFPKLAVMEEGTAYSEVKRRLPWLVIGMVMVCGIGAWLSPHVIPWLYTSAYRDSVLYTQLLFIPVILGTPAMVLRRGALQSQRKTGKLLRVNLVVALFELALLAVFTLRFGLLGIVIARALARAFDSAYAWLLTR